MARIRSVHPGLFTDEAFVACSPLARLLFIGTWTEADDFGAFEWKPLQLKMRVLPVDNVDMAKLLSELSDADMVRRYSISRREFGLIRNFGRFQRPKKPKSLHPIPPELRPYGCCDHRSSAPDGDEDTGVPKKSEPRSHQPVRVLQTSRISPQMEDGGCSKNPFQEEPLRLGTLSGGRTPVGLGENHDRFSSVDDARDAAAYDVDFLDGEVDHAA